MTSGKVEMGSFCINVPYTKRDTAPNAELLVVQLGIAKATSLDVDCIVVIADSFTKKALDPSHHHGQGESIAIAHLL